MAFPHRLVMHRCVMCHDERFGHRYVPAINVRVPHERGCYFVRTNAQGFRSDFDFERRRGDRPRVLLFGDSFSSGDGVSNRERFSDLLAAQSDLEVLNFSVSGSGADQHVLMLEELGLGYEPDLLLICVAAHTIARVQQDHRVTTDRLGRRARAARPHFVLRGDELELLGVPVLEPTAVEALDFLEGEVAPALDSSALVGLGDTLTARFGSWPAQTMDDARRRAAYFARRCLQRAGLREREDDYARGDSNGWRLLSRILQRFHASAAGTPVVIVPLPTVDYSVGGLEPHYQRRFEELEDAARGLHVADVTTPLAAEPFAVRKTYSFERDGHLAPAAHVAIAAALSAKLTRLGLVPHRAPRMVTGLRTRTGSREVLTIGWEPHDVWAQLTRDGVLLAAASERALVGYAPCPGSLPYAAISSCLELEGLDGDDLQRIELVSPESLDETLMKVSDTERGASQQVGEASSRRLLAPWVRWLGAAEADVRRLLHFQGTVDQRCGAGAVVHSGPQLEPQNEAASIEEELDLEGAWLEEALDGLLVHHRTQAARFAALRALARRWERATRRARHAVLP